MIGAPDRPACRQGDELSPSDRMIEFTAPSPEKPYACFIATEGENPSAIPSSKFIQAYKTHGAMLLRGFSVEMNGFRTLTSQYCASSVFNESPDRKLLDNDRNIQTVNFGADPFPLHPELSREPWKPDICFFWCVSPPREGGQTTLCDGIEIVRQMPSDLFGAFENRRLVYTQRMAPAVCAYWLGRENPNDQAINNPRAGCPYTFARAPGGVTRSFSRPALHKPMFSDALAFGNFVLFARYYLRLPTFPVFDGNQHIPNELVAKVKEISDRLTAPIDWCKNDIIVLDNTRFMHGRKAIFDIEERVIATYFGYLNFAEPDPEEPANALWRQGSFRPPQPGAPHRNPAPRISN